MCPLLALGEFKGSPSDVRHLISDINKSLVQHGSLSFPISDNMHASAVPEAGEVKYDLLWAILNPSMQQIEIENAWWRIMAKALRATVHIYNDQDGNTQIKEIATHGNAENQIHIHHRTGHYTMMIPICEEDRILREIEHNKRYDAMF